MNWTSTLYAAEQPTYLAEVPFFNELKRIQGTRTYRIGLDGGQPLMLSERVEPRPLPWDEATAIILVAMADAGVYPAERMRQDVECWDAATVTEEKT